VARAQPLLRSPAVAVALLVGLIWLVFAPPTPDLAAAVYRAGLFNQTGYAIWDGQWYGGHHMPGYSLLFPPLGALLGVRLVGVASAIASAYLFEQLATRHFGPRAKAGALWLAVATVCDLLIGRLTFGLGVAVGLGALLALQRDRPRLAGALALACAAASPVSGLFLALAGVALWLGGGMRRGLVLTVPALALVFALAVAFPEGGRQPFAVVDAALVLFSCVSVWLAMPREERVIRVGTLLYAAATVAAFVLPTPMGSNAARLGATFAGPLVVCAVGRKALRWPLVGVLIGLAAWQWWPPVREVVKGAGDPSTSYSYYAPLVAFLQTQGNEPMRLEVPFTRMHWEAVHLARRYPLARGWETQLDTKFGKLFYEGSDVLDAERYQRWLQRNGVRFVALPDAALDPTAKAEARLIESGPAYLREVWHDEHWRVFAVRDSPGLTSGPGTLTELHADSFTLKTTGPGTVLVRVRHTPYWDVVSGTGCVEATPDGAWTSVTVPHAETVKVVARFTLPKEERCTTPR
jgi:hypothetical protein